MSDSSFEMKVHRFVSIVTALLLPQGSYSEPTLVIEAGFSSELEAVKAAADFYNPLSVKHDREYIGAILRTDTGFGFTVVAGNKAADSVEFSIDRETWVRTTALWHTHGGTNFSHRYFSERDTRTAKRLDIPFYLADYTGYLKVYRSGDATLSPFVARRLGLNFRGGYAIGSHVLDGFGRPVRVRTRG